MRFLTDTLRLQRLATLILPLFLLGLFFDAHHQAAFEHEVCHVDGALTHAEDGHAHEGERKSSGEEQEHVHEHCGLPTLDTEAGEVLSTALFGSTRIDSGDATLPALEFAAACESLYRLAPKNSPPALT